jgi:hypothetical protein
MYLIVTRLMHVGRLIETIYECIDAAPARMTGHTWRRMRTRVRITARRPGQGYHRVLREMIDQSIGVPDARARHLEVFERPA